MGEGKGIDRLGNLDHPGRNFIAGDNNGGGVALEPEIVGEAVAEGYADPVAERDVYKRQVQANAAER